MSRPGKTLTATLALLLASLLLAACGGADDEGSSSGASEETTAGAATTAQTEPSEDDSEAPSGPSDEEQIETAIEALLVDPDNELVCNEVLTESLIATAYGDLQGCLDGRKQAVLADSLKRVEMLRVSGDSAEAEAVAKGGLYDGEKLEIEAVRGGDGWRIEQFIADIPVGP